MSLSFTASIRKVTCLQLPHLHHYPLAPGSTRLALRYVTSSSRAIALSSAKDDEEATEWDVNKSAKCTHFSTAEIRELKSWGNEAKDGNDASSASYTPLSFAAAWTKGDIGGEHRVREHQGWNREIGDGRDFRPITYAPLPVATAWIRDIGGLRDQEPHVHDRAQEAEDDAAPFTKHSLPTREQRWFGGERQGTSLDYLHSTSHAQKPVNHASANQDCRNRIAADVLDYQPRMQFPTASRDWITLALSQIGRDDITPYKNPGKGNLSRRADRSRVLRTELQEPELPKEVEEGRTGAPSDPRAPANPCKSSERSVQRILAAAIVRIGRPKPGMAAILTQDEDVLIKLGHNALHVEAWANILMRLDANEALEEFEALREAQGRRAAPQLVLSYLLRRRAGTIGAEGLRIALHEAKSIAMEEHRRRVDVSFFVLCVRLLRHARVVWPAKIANIADLLVAGLPSVGDIKPERIADLTDMANSALQLVSLPSGYESFANFVHQESAMIKILEYMENNQLHMSRAGYRAVIRIQLATPKTDNDRRWNELKALSWPPWKEDKTQLDSQITRETHGTSRAMSTLMQMEASGYAPYVWEQSAKLYAGWDDDGTPTIQTRFLMPLSSTSAMNWAARIATTRSAQEAWAAFLAWEKVTKFQSSVVYEAILRKLFEEDRRVAREHNADRRKRARGSELDRGVTPLPIPGEQREISPPPKSTHLHTYTKTPPPSHAQLYQQLIRAGVRPSPRCVAYLISTASSIIEGIRYLRDVQERVRGMRSESINNFADWSQDHGDDFRQVLSAYIDMLCRHSDLRLPRSMAQPDGPILLGGQPVITITAFVAAHELYSQWKHPPDRAWLALMGSLANRRALQSVSTIFGWTGKDLSFKQAHTAAQILHELFEKRKTSSVELEIASLLHLCNAHSSVIIEGWLALGKSVTRSRVISEDVPSMTSETNVEVLAYFSRPSPILDFRSLFWHTINAGFQPDAAVSEDFLPIPVMPSPAVLHAYIRAVGWDGDHVALVEVLRWCTRHHSRLVEHVARDRNGQAMLRKCVIAVRAFMERDFVPTTLVPDVSEQSSNAEKALVQLEQSASARLLRQAKDLVESFEAWGGWPTDEEVEEYIDLLTKRCPFRAIHAGYEPVEES